jgi:hypothetical protein
MTDGSAAARRRIVHMPIDVFIGGDGDLVLVQEVTEPEGETYLRLRIDLRDCDALCASIRTAALQENAP